MRGKPNEQTYVAEIEEGVKQGEMERDIYVDDGLLGLLHLALIHNSSFLRLSLAVNLYFLLSDVILVDGPRHDPVHHGYEGIKQDEHPADSG